MKRKRILFLLALPSILASCTGAIVNTSSSSSIDTVTSSENPAISSEEKVSSADTDSSATEESTTPIATSDEPSLTSIVEEETSEERIEQSESIPQETSSELVKSESDTHTQEVESSEEPVTTSETPVETSETPVETSEDKPVETSETHYESSEEIPVISSHSSSVESDLPEINYIKVYTTYTHVWAWTNGNKNLFSAWPGQKMTKDEDGWYTWDFNEYTELNFVFSNNGKEQSADLSVSEPGHWFFYNQAWYHNIDPIKHQDDIPEPEPAVIGTEIVNKAATVNEFPLWDSYDDDHWKIVSPYKGKRTDFRDETIYFAMTTRFYDGDSSNNTKCWDGKNNASDDPAWRGDFKGLIQRMDYIKALGFTSIWITPVTENASGYDYHGYHTVNFSKVDKRYTSEDVDFQDVITEAHNRDMKIILDVVFNHTSNFGEENLFPMFTKNENDTTINGMVRNNNNLLPANYDSLPSGQQYSARIDAMKNDSSDTNNIYHHEKSLDWNNYIVETGQIAGDCVDLNTENPTVANYLIKTYGEFIRMGVDGFRIDTVKHISRLTFNNYIWPGLKAYAKKCGNNNFFMFGEVCNRWRSGPWDNNVPTISTPFYTWKESKSYPWGTRAENEASTKKQWDDNQNADAQPTSNNVFLNGVTYHTPDYSRSSGCSVIDFPMHWNFQHASDAYGAAMACDRYINDASYNVVYVDSHDYGPDGQEKIRYNEGTNAWKENLALMFTFRGIPCIYYGSEIQFQAGKVIDEGPNIALKDSGRAYYGDHLEGNVTASAFGTYSASGEVQKTLSNTLSQHIIKLNKIRAKVPALRLGQYKDCGNMKFVRRYTAGGVDSLAVVAISGGASFSGLPSGTYVDLVSGNRVSCSGTLNVSVSGQGNYAVYVLENSSTGTLSKIN